jgi:transcriptional regulator with XRE-family HTH domain
LERLLIERARQRVTMAELSRRSGVDVHTISDIERGNRRPHGSTLVKLAEALGVEPEEFLGKVPAPVGK